MRKKVFFFILIFMSLLLLGTAVFIKEDVIKVTAATYPYNILSKKTSADFLDIKLFCNLKKCYFTKKEKIVDSYISGKEGKIKLSLKSISLSENTVNIKGDKYFEVNYHFLIDKSFDSAFSLLIKKAYLYLSFSNDVSSNIYIGSFSFYKYEENCDDFTFCMLKAITEKDGKDGFYGALIGIRNTKDEDIEIKNIKLLDVNIENTTIVSINEDDNSIKYEDYLDKNNINNFIIPKNEVKYFAVLINDTCSLMHPPSNIGLKIEFNDKEFYLENFNFYKMNIFDYNLYSFNIYEYKN